MKHSRSAAAVCAALFMGLGSGAAVAGEVKGPPGSVENPPSESQYNWKAILHANSICVFSGLNDFNQGPTDNPTQTPADFPAGSAGHGFEDVFPIGCVGGSNPYNPPS
jgi:hypothetical protein